MEALILLAAFAAGLAFRQLGYPPLLGYLVAGFVAHGAGLGTLDDIRPIADLGIILLLFTIGLKLNLRQLAAPRIWGTQLLHAGIVVPLTAMVSPWPVWPIRYSRWSSRHRPGCWLSLCPSPVPFLP